MLSNLLGYLKTFIISLVVVFITTMILLASAQYQVYKSINEENTSDQASQAYLIGVLIDKNKYLESQDPKNYKINLKLALLYQSVKDYVNAEIQYKLSIQKAPFNEFSPVYRLAIFYIQRGKVEKGLALIDSVRERPDYTLINYKGEVYETAGEAYYDTGDYSTAIECYEKALSYYEITKYGKIKALKESLASAYVYLSEEFIQKMDIENAVASLETAYSYMPVPILEYKLAILLMKSEPERSYEYFQDVFKKTPAIIDFKVYYGFLQQLAYDADATGNTAQAELYRFKAKKYKEYYDANIITMDDLSIDFLDGKISYNPIWRKYNMNLQLRLRNISDRTLKSLFVYVIFKDEDGSVITDYTAQIVDDKTVLAPSDLTPFINIKSEKKRTKTDKPPKVMTADIYFSIQENSYKLRLTSLKLEQKIKKKHKPTKFFGIDLMKLFNLNQTKELIFK